MPATNPPKPLSPLRRLLGFAAILASMVICGLLGLWLAGAFTSGTNQTARIVAPSPAPASALLIFVFWILAALVAAVGAGLYGLAIAVNCFVSPRQPILPGLSSMLWLMNLVVSFVFEGAMSLTLGPLLVIPLSMFMSQGISILVGFGIPFVIGNFVFAWLSLGTPIVKRLTTRRLLVRGFSAQQLETGLPVGTSDPGKSSLKKFGMIEEDLGMLWIGADELVYYGDHTNWTIPHADLLEVERVADAGSVAALFGAIHVILRFRIPDGSERRIRLHPEVPWTGTGKARALNAIGDRLDSWLTTPTPGWPIPQGFAVTPAVPVPAIPIPAPAPISAPPPLPIPPRNH